MKRGGIAIEVAKELGTSSNANFYFQEDKPYGGIAIDIEKERINAFINNYQLQSRTFHYDPERLIDLAFTHYISQVEEVYKTGIRNRARFLQEFLNAKHPCDRIYYYNPRHTIKAN